MVPGVQASDLPVKPCQHSNDQGILEDSKPVISSPANTDPLNKEDIKQKLGLPAPPATNYSVTDCRSLVKTLICGVKTITWGCASNKVRNTMFCLGFLHCKINLY